MKKLTFLFALVLAIGMPNLAKAQVQNYNKAIGLRLGNPLSVSFKTFIMDDSALEVYAGLGGGYAGGKYFNLGAMYQRHMDIEGVDGLAWFFGGGGSLQFWNYDSGYAGGSLIVGVNGVIGLDYEFANAPLNLSIDWTPTILIGDLYAGLDLFRVGYGALSARYILN